MNKDEQMCPTAHPTISCGLDFGTSNSVITLTDTCTRKELFTYSANSILYFPDNENNTCYIGAEAQSKYVEDGMTGRLLKSVKTLLKQDDFLFTWIGGKKMTPDQLVTYIIRHLKEKAEAFTGTTLTDVVLGRPAVFSEIEIYVTTLLQQAGYDASQIDSVFLTGGSSLALPVRNMLCKLFEESKLRQGDTFNSVAYGLSLNH